MASPFGDWRNEESLSAPVIIGGTAPVPPKDTDHLYFFDIATQHNNLLRQQEIVLLSVKSYGIRQTSMEDLLTSKNRFIDAKNALMNTTNRLGLLMRQFVWQLGAPLPVPSPPEK